MLLQPLQAAGDERRLVHGVVENPVCRYDPRNADCDEKRNGPTNHLVRRGRQALLPASDETVMRERSWPSGMNRLCLPVSPGRKGRTREYKCSTTSVSCRAN